MTTSPQEPGTPEPDEPTGPTDPDPQPENPDTAQPDVVPSGGDAPMTIETPSMPEGEPGARGVQGDDDPTAVAVE